MLVTIDRFEGNFAVVETEDGQMVNMPSVLVPNAKEGDCIKIEIDREKTLSQKEEIKNLMDSLFE